MSHSSSGKMIRVTPSNYRQAIQRADVGILKTKTVNLPVDESESLAALNNQNQSRFHTANGYQNLRPLNRNASLAETLINATTPIGNGGKKDGNNTMVNKYHGKKIYVFHSPQAAQMNSAGSFHGRLPRSLEIGGVAFPHSSQYQHANQDLGPQNFANQEVPAGDSPYSGLKSNYNPDDEQ
jgi:hypothetical protein